jgi:hypothetical protein
MVTTAERASVKKLCEAASEMSHHVSIMDGPAMLDYVQLLRRAGQTLALMGMEQRGQFWTDLNDVEAMVGRRGEW